jgi:nitrogen fixation protein FixH
MDPERRWPWGIATVLALTVAGNAVIYYAANDANAAAVEPDYYRKAVEWDSTLAQADRNQRLGWTADVDLGPLESGGTSEATIRLRDADGSPVSGARLGITAIHNAIATTPLHAVATTDSTGRARLTLPLGHHGLWEFRLEASRGTQRYTASLRQDTEPRDSIQ